MVKHMIIWKFKESVEDKQNAALQMKEALEGLVGRIDGLLEMHIITSCYPSSTGDVMMDSAFRDNDALLAYQKHPLHVAIADTLVRPVMETRMAYDYDL